MLDARIFASSAVSFKRDFASSGLMNIFGWLFHPKEQVEYQFDLSISS